MGPNPPAPVGAPPMGPQMGHQMGHHMGHEMGGMPDPMATEHAMVLTELAMEEELLSRNDNLRHSARLVANGLC